MQLRAAAQSARSGSTEYQVLLVGLGWGQLLAVWASTPISLWAAVTGRRGRPVPELVQRSWENEAGVRQKVGGRGERDYSYTRRHTDSDACYAALPTT